MNIRLRLARLEVRQDARGDEPLLIITGVPSGERDDGTGLAVARGVGQWLPRDEDEAAAAFLARVDALSRQGGQP